MKEFLSDLAMLIFGTTNFAVVFGSLFFDIAGIIALLLIEARARWKKSDDSPDFFSYDYLIGNNKARLFTGLFLSLFALRFLGQIKPIENEEAFMFASFGVGLACDGLALVFKKFNVFGTNPKD